MSVIRKRKASPYGSGQSYSLCCSAKQILKGTIYFVMNEGYLLFYLLLLLANLVAVVYI